MFKFKSEQEFNDWVKKNNIKVIEGGKVHDTDTSNNDPDSNSSVSPSNSSRKVPQISERKDYPIEEFVLAAVVLALLVWFFYL